MQSSLIKNQGGNKLGRHVFMMDEFSVMERAFFTVVPLTAVLRSGFDIQNAHCPSRMQNLLLLALG